MVLQMRIVSNSISSIALALVLVAGAFPAHAATAVGRSDETFLTNALREARIEARLGNTAAAKAVDPYLKGFARQMERDNSIIGRELGRIARGESLSVRKGMDKDQNEDLNKLSKLNGLGFEQAYLRYVIEKRENDIGDYRKEIKHGSFPDLKNFAANTKPMLETEIKTANLLMEEQRLIPFLIDP